MDGLHLRKTQDATLECIGVGIDTVLDRWKSDGMANCTFSIHGEAIADVLDEGDVIVRVNGIDESPFAMIAEFVRQPPVLAIATLRELGGSEDQRVEEEEIVIDKFLDEDMSRLAEEVEWCILLPAEEGELVLSIVGSDGGRLERAVKVAMLDQPDKEAFSKHPAEKKYPGIMSFAQRRILHHRRHVYLDKQEALKSQALTDGNKSDEEEEEVDERAVMGLRIALADPAMDPVQLAHAIQAFNKAPQAVRSAPAAKELFRRAVAMQGLWDWRIRFRSTRNELRDALGDALDEERQRKHALADPNFVDSDADVPPLDTGRLVLAVKNASNYEADLGLQLIEATAALNRMEDENRCTLAKRRMIAITHGAREDIDGLFAAVEFAEQTVLPAWVCQYRAVDFTPALNRNGGGEHVLLTQRPQSRSAVLPQSDHTWAGHTTPESIIPVPGVDAASIEAATVVLEDWRAKHKKGLQILELRELIAALEDEMGVRDWEDANGSGAEVQRDIRDALKRAQLPEDEPVVHEAEEVLKNWGSENLVLRSEARLASAVRRCQKGYSQFEPVAGDRLANAIAEVSMEGVAANFLDGAHEVLQSWRADRLYKATKELAFAMEYKNPDNLRDAIAAAKIAGVDPDSVDDAMATLQQLEWEEEVNKALSKAMADPSEVPALEAGIAWGHEALMVEEESQALMSAVLQYHARFWSAELQMSVREKEPKGLDVCIAAADGLLSKCESECKTRLADVTEDLILKSLERDTRTLRLALPGARELANVHGAEQDLKRVLGAVERNASELPRVINRGAKQVPKGLDGALVRDARQHLEAYNATVKQLEDVLACKDPTSGSLLSVKEATIRAKLAGAPADLVRRGLDCLGGPEALRARLGLPDEKMAVTFTYNLQKHSELHIIEKVKLEWQQRNLHTCIKSSVQTAEGVELVSRINGVNVFLSREPTAADFPLVFAGGPDEAAVSKQVLAMLGTRSTGDPELLSLTEDELDVYIALAEADDIGVLSVESRFLRMTNALDVAKRRKPTPILFSAETMQEVETTSVALAAEQGLFQQMDAARAVLDGKPATQAEVTRCAEALSGACASIETVGMDEAKISLPEARALRERLDEDLDARQAAESQINAIVRARGAPLRDVRAAIVAAGEAGLPLAVLEDAYAKLERLRRAGKAQRLNPPLLDADGEGKRVMLSGAFTEKRCGGSFGTRTWRQNPQYLLGVSKGQSARVTVILEPKGEMPATLSVHVVQNSTVARAAGLGPILVPGFTVIASSSPEEDTSWCSFELTLTHRHNGMCFIVPSAAKGELGEFTLDVCATTKIEVREVTDDDRSPWLHEESLDLEWSDQRAFQRFMGGGRSLAKPPGLSWYRNPQFKVQMVDAPPPPKHATSRTSMVAQTNPAEPLLLAILTPVAWKPQGAPAAVHVIHNRAARLEDRKRGAQRDLESRVVENPRFHHVLGSSSTEEDEYRMAPEICAACRLSLDADGDGEADPVFVVPSLETVESVGTFTLTLLATTKVTVERVV